MLTLHWTFGVTMLLSIREELDLQEKESFQREKIRGGLWGNHLGNGCVGAVFCSRKSVLYKETWPKSCHQGLIVKTWKYKQCWTEEKCSLFLVLLPCTVGIWNRHSVKMSKRDGIKYSAFLEGSFFLTCGNRGSEQLLQSKTLLSSAVSWWRRLLPHYKSFGKTPFSSLGFCLLISWGRNPSGGALWLSPLRF